MDKRILAVSLLGMGAGLFLTTRSVSDETDIFCNLRQAQSAPLPNATLIFANTPSMNDLACARFSGDTSCGVTDNGTNFFLNLKATTSIASVSNGPSAYTLGNVYSETVSSGGAWGWGGPVSGSPGGDSISTYCSSAKVPAAMQATCTTNLQNYGYFMLTSGGGIAITCSVAFGDISSCSLSGTTLSGTCSAPNSCPKGGGSCGGNDFQCTNWSTGQPCPSGSIKTSGGKDSCCYGTQANCSIDCPETTGTCITVTMPAPIVFTGDLLNYYPPKYIMAEAVFDQLYPDIRSDPTLTARVAVMDTSGRYGQLVTPGFHPPCGNCDGSNPSIPNSYYNDINGMTANTISQSVAAGLMGVGQLASNDDTYFRCLLCDASGLSTSCTLNPTPLASSTLINPPGNCGSASDTICQKCNWTCQKSYAIVISDGMMDPDAGVVPTGLTSYGNDGDVYHLDEVAAWLANSDMRPDAGSSSPCTGSCNLTCAQTVNTHVIGFDTLMHQDVLSKAAQNGGGNYVMANNFDTLLQAIKDSLHAIVNKNRFFAAPSIASFSTSLGLNVYFSSFVPGQAKAYWPGHVRAYYAGINVNSGTLQFYDRNQTPVTNLSSVGSGVQCGLTSTEQVPPPLWDAGECLSSSTAQARVFYQYPNGMFVPQSYQNCNVSMPDRKVFTYIPGTGWQQFTTTNAALTSAPGLFGLPSTATSDDVKFIIQYALGPKEIVQANVSSGAQCPTGSTYAASTTFFPGTCFSGAVLGDAFHSSPVLVSYPSDHLKESQGCTQLYTGYQEYSAAQLGRKRIIVVGTNDGMLHAFDAGTWTATTTDLQGFPQSLYDTGTGKELWAFIPLDLLPNLKNILNPVTTCTQHQFYVDASPMVGEAWWRTYADNKAHADEWHTILIQGERMGGNHFFALDITDPLLGLASNTTPPPSAFLWYFPNDLSASNPTGTGAVADTGYTWSETYPNPAAIGPFLFKAGSFPNGRPMSTGNAQWMTVLNGGYSADDTHGKGAYMLDVSTGDIMWSKTDFVHSVSASVAGVDIFPSPPQSADCVFDTLIVADRAGELWRVNAKEPGEGSVGNITNWSPHKFFTAPSGLSMEFIAATTLAPCFENPDSRDLRVFLGTGDRQAPVDCSVTQRFYAMTATPTSTLQEANLTLVSTTNPIPASGGCGTAGWYMTLPSPGEKVLAAADIGCHEVFFTTYVPDRSNTGCGGGLGPMSCAFLGGTGASYLYALDYITAGTIVTTTGGYCVTMPTGSVTLGSGVPPAPKLVQVYYEGKLYNVLVSLASEGTPLPSPGAPQTVSPLGLIFWLEVPNDLHDYLKSHYGLHGITR